MTRSVASSRRNSATAASARPSWTTGQAPVAPWAAILPPSRRPMAIRCWKSRCRLRLTPRCIRNFRYNTERDFTAVIFAGSTPNILVVHPSVPVTTVQQLIALAKANPARLTYASTGSGTSNHMSMELFKMMTHTDIVHVPYKGSAPAVTDLMGGHVMMIFDNTPNVLPYVKTGRMRGIAVTSLKRSALAPELPTVDESGVKGFEVLVWFGVVAPAGVPREIITRLNTEINRILLMPDVRERFQAGGVDPVGGPPEKFGEHLKAEIAKWGKVVKATGARVD